LVNNKFFDFKKMIESNTKWDYKNGIRNFKDSLYGHAGQTLDSATFMYIDIDTKKTWIILTWNSSADLSKLQRYFRKR
jgi:predicted oxidoreductase